MDYNIGQSRLATFFKNLIGGNTPKSEIDMAREKFINSYFSSFKHTRNDRGTFGVANSWDKDGLRMISHSGRYPHMMSVNSSLINLFTNMLGLSQDEVYRIILTWVSKQLRTKVTHLEPFTFGE